MTADSGQPRPESSPGEISLLLEQARFGDASAGQRVYGLVYAQLRGLAAGYLRRQGPGHSLQPSDIVHEAFLRLAGAAAMPKDRNHFFALAARAMRQVLVDHARRKNAAKRGGDLQQVTLDDNLGIAGGHIPSRIDLLDLDRALQELGNLHERQSRVAELRFFAGFTIAETAEALGVSTDTVEDDTVVARTWLRRALRAS